MRRRQFLISSAALAWPLAARAQRAIPFIGFLNSGSPNERKLHVEALRQGLKEGGYVDGQNLAIEYRWAEGRYDLLPQLATELVDRKVAILIAAGTAGVALAAKSATSTIPIVFVGGWDPVKLGVVTSLSRPGGNVTGVANVGRALDGKRIELLRDLVPAATRIAYLVNQNVPDVQSLIKEVQSAGATAGAKVQVLNASNETEIDSAFTTLAQNRVNALVVTAESLFITRRDQIVALAARHGIAACYPFREFAMAGGLMSYGADLRADYRTAGVYAARILKGAKPADLPVVQATRFELVLNLKTAKQLRLNISRDFLARVDEVIQ